MRSAAGLGALFGALIGILPAVAMAALLDGFDESMGSTESGSDASLYGFSVLLGCGVGAVVGLVSAVIGAAVARSASGDVRSRRTKGAWTSAGAAAAPLLLLSIFGPVVSIGIVVVVAMTWTIAWWALPRVVDLESSGAAQLPAQYGDQPAEPRPPLAPLLRWAIIAVSAGLGGLLVTNFVMSLVDLSVSRQTEESIAFGVVAVSAAAIGFLAWRLTDRRNA